MPSRRPSSPSPPHPEVGERAAPATAGAPPVAASAGTRDRLVRAAFDAFNADGFHGTDSNRIARRAGFAPQTFYRHFKDKTDIFVAAYGLWGSDERRALRAAGADQAPALDAARAVVAHHAATRVFRRSLRELALVEPRVRAARTQSRLDQIAAARRRGGIPGPADAVLLLQIERVADALAERELEDLGVPTEAGLSALGDLIDAFRAGAAAGARRL